MFHVDMFRILFSASCATVSVSCWLTTMALVFTVKAIRAPMGTKATPTASLSIFMSTRIQDVDARSVWCQLREQQITFQPSELSVHPQPTSPRSSFTLRLHIPPYVRWLWICKWNGRSLTRTQWRTGISMRLSALQTWNKLKLRNILCGRGLWKWVKSS